MHLETLTSPFLALGLLLLPAFCNARVIPGDSNSNNPHLMNHSISSLSTPSTPPPSTPVVANTNSESKHSSVLNKRQFGPTACINECHAGVCMPRCGANPTTFEDGLCIMNCQTSCTLECSLQEINSQPFVWPTPPTPSPAPSPASSTAPVANVKGLGQVKKVKTEPPHDDHVLHEEVADFVGKWSSQVQALAGNANVNVDANQGQGDEYNRVESR